MRRMIAAAALAATGLGSLGLVGTAAPAVAQSRADQARWDAAQARYQGETERYYAERDRYFSMRRGGRGGYDGAPPPPPPGGGYGAGGYGAGGYAQDGYSSGGYARDDRDEGSYDPSRYYRPGQERVLGTDDRVYAGNDGRYYCKRSDGTTGLIVGAAGGGVLGNVIDGGHSRTAGTLIGAAIGALAGKAVDQSNSQIRCR